MPGVTRGSRTRDICDTQGAFVTEVTQKCTRARGRVALTKGPSQTPAALLEANGTGPRRRDSPPAAQRLRRACRSTLNSSPTPTWSSCRSASMAPGPREARHRGVRASEDHGQRLALEASGAERPAEVVGPRGGVRVGRAPNANAATGNALRQGGPDPLRRARPAGSPRPSPDQPAGRAQRAVRRSRRSWRNPHSAGKHRLEQAYLTHRLSRTRGSGSSPHRPSGPRAARRRRAVAGPS